jgi:UDP-N-acetylglucosamine:LPS N-acetylglucosamine transferase
VNATPVLAGETMVLTKGGALTVSAITATGNATVYFTSGSGN